MGSAYADIPVQEVGPFSRHRPALDGIRGLAILGVVASHIFPGTPGNNVLYQWLYRFLTFGAAGVDLFFTLSGFLITGILVDSLSDQQYFRKFYARRALRIFPLYYGTLLVLLILTPWLGIQWHHELWSLAFYLQNTRAAAPLYTFASRVSLGHFWSLAVEEQFYLVWPLLVFFIRDVRKLLWACLTLSVVSFVLRYVLLTHHVPYPAVNANTLCRADSLLAGGALALLLRTRAYASVLRAGRWIFAASSIGLVLLSFTGDRLQPSLIKFACLYTIYCTVLALCSANLINWSLSNSVSARLFQWKPLRFMGKYSYGIYILHLIVFTALQPLLRRGLLHFSKNKSIGILATGLIAFGLSVLLAYASYHLYEKQFLRLKRYFRYDKPEALGLGLQGDSLQAQASSPRL
jgi:peptidoglycan/LPS O-acetylase OafA/YrhL